MPTRADYVAVRDATFRSPGGLVFAGTTFTLPADETWLVRGASGAGKSTFVAALRGQLPRVTGSLEHPFLAGRADALDSVFGVLPPGTIAVASMEQHRALTAACAFHQWRWHGSLTAGAVTVADFLEQNAVEGRSPFVVASGADDGERYAARRAREVRRFELAPLLERPLLALSNGELHRLLVARALLLEPGLLVVDDPFAGLDARTRGLLTEILAALPAEGTGVLYTAARDEDIPRCVTHELEVSALQVVYAGPRRTPAFAPAPRATAAEPTGKPPTASADAPAPDQSGAPPAAEPSPAVPVLELRGATVRCGELTLLEGVDLTIRAGERWAILGPNGAGKSTLLALIMADHPQSHVNHLRVCGRRLGPGTSIWDLKRCLGSVSPELDVHYPAWSPVVDVVVSGFSSSLGRHTRIGPDEHAAAAAWLALLGLAERATAAFGSLPRLERRVALLARAAVRAPRLLLLDEPCQGLDALDRGRFADALERVLTKLDAALVYVTHEAAELPPSVDRRLELSGGRVLRCGRFR